MRTSKRDPETTEFRKRANHLRNVLDHFRNRFRREYLTELREHQRFKKPKKGRPVNIGDVVTIFEDKIPRQRWSLGRIEKLLPSSGGEIRSAVVRVNKAGHRNNTIRRPLARLYPVEIGEDIDAEDIIENHQSQVADESEPEIQFIADEEVKELMENYS